MKDEILKKLDALEIKVYQLERMIKEEKHERNKMREEFMAQNLHLFDKNGDYAEIIANYEERFQNISDEIRKIRKEIEKDG